jgi:hypothetical protein
MNKPIKKILLSLVFISLLVSKSWGACNVSTDSNTATSSGSIAIGQFGFQWFANKIVAGSTYTLCSVVLRMDKVSSPTTNLVAKIYSDSSGSPGTQIGSTSSSVASSSLPTSEGDVTFSNMSSSLTSGTTYWIVVYIDASDNSNYPEWYWDGSIDSNHIQVSSNGTSWSSLSDHPAKFTAYKDSYTSVEGGGRQHQ